MPRDAAALSVTYRVIPQLDRGYAYWGGLSSLDAVWTLLLVACPLSLPSTYGSTSRSSGSVRQGYRPLIHALSLHALVAVEMQHGEDTDLTQPSPVGRKRNDSPRIGESLRCVTTTAP
jgi:hypothetical protein